MLIPTIFLFLFPSVKIYVLVGGRFEIKIGSLVAFTTTWKFKGLCVSFKASLCIIDFQILHYSIVAT